MLDRLITDSLDELKYSPVPTTDEIVCPICYVGVSSPEQLGCGHTYCSSCLRHYLTSATDSALFPLTCMGDEDRCKIPIPIPTIQRFLTAQKMDQLLQSAFTTYIDKHLQEFKYCGTPDCGQVYRTAQDGGSRSTLQCPSCFASVCNACGEEGHEGMTCEDYKLQSDPTEQERMTEAFAKVHNIKKCPSCQVWMEKIAGCNHMTCRCGAHVCWVCMKSYPQDIIYQHMAQAHGSIGLDDQVPFVNDIERERQVLENYRLANRMLQEQEQLRMQQEIQRQEDIRRREQQRRQEEARERERAAAQRQALLQRYQAVQTEREAAQRYATYTSRQAGTATNQPYIRAQPRKEESGSWCVVM
ncbi:hypothetical protein QCA50_004763 [Cerrena zonata]|uniref:RBR-type E3 ubiquitin transferase n=1 Tax=Cerrena zonata TaxID=2478898 RepID=A0AAW0GDH5_9APHY